MTPAEILRLSLQLRLAEHVNTCTDPKKKARAQSCESAFTGIVSALKGPHCRSEAIRGLASELWDIVGGGKVKTAMFDAIATLHFSVHREPTGDVGMILIPKMWPEAVLADPIFCIGGVVFTGSQAVSWQQHGRLGTALHNRARAYEAEYLAMIRSTDSTYRFNEYQRGVLRDYPLGFASFSTN